MSKYKEHLTELKRCVKTTHPTTEKILLNFLINFLFYITSDIIILEDNQHKYRGFFKLKGVIMQIQPISTTSNLQFKGWKVNGDKILRANNGELRNYAEHFHKLKKEELAEIATVKDFFGLKMEKDSNDASAEGTASRTLCEHPVLCPVAQSGRNCPQERTGRKDFFLSRLFHRRWKGLYLRIPVMCKETG